MYSVLSDEELLYYNDMIAYLYDESDYVKAFSGFLERLKKIIDFQKGDIYFYKDGNKHIVFDSFITVGWDKESLNQYINHYADIDDALPIISLRHPVMFRSSDIFLQSERSKTKYYNELLLPTMMDYSIEGNIYDGQEGYVAGISIHRPSKYDDFSLRDLEIMKLCRSHLSNIAVKYLETLQSVESDSIYYPSEYQKFDMGLCIMDSNLNVIDSNLQSFTSVDPEHSVELIQAIHSLAQDISSSAKSVDNNNNESPLIAKSRIIVDGTPYYVEISRQQLSDGDVQFTTMLFNFNNMIDLILSESEARYNLTRREREVLGLAIRGRDNREISKELFISIATVKKHLTNIYMKIGIDGKHQLFNKLF